jgi:hypothetical protein
MVLIGVFTSIDPRDFSSLLALNLIFITLIVKVLIITFLVIF